MKSVSLSEVTLKRGSNQDSPIVRRAHRAECAADCTVRLEKPVGEVVRQVLPKRYDSIVQIGYNRYDVGQAFT